MRRKNLLFLFIVPAVFLLSAFTGKEQNKTLLKDENWLKDPDDQIVNQKGDTVYLRGSGLGGMLHLENFIVGYPGNEKSMRDGLKKILSEEKCNLFKDLTNEQLVGIARSFRFETMKNGTDWKLFRQVVRNIYSK